MLTRNTLIHRQLQRLETAGIIRSFYCQSNMPGYRWTLDIPGYGRTFTTNEVEAFLVGVAASMPVPA